MCVLVIFENSLLVEPAERKVAAMSLSLGKDPGSWALCWAGESWHEQMEETNAFLLKCGNL